MRMDGQIGIHGEGNSHFSIFFERTQKQAGIGLLNDVIHPIVDQANHSDAVYR
jgi:hypothetical protein